MIDIHHTPSWYCYYCCMTTSKQSVKCRSTKYPKVSCWSSSPVGVLSTPASNGCRTTNFPRLALTNPWILPTLRWCSTMPAVEPLYHPLIELKKGPQGRTKLRKGPTGPTAVVFYSYTWSSTPKIADLPMVLFFCELFDAMTTWRCGTRGTPKLHCSRYLMAIDCPWFRRNRSCQIDM